MIRRVTSQDLGAQSLPHLALFPKETHTLTLELVIHLTELAHLRVPLPLHVDFFHWRERAVLDGVAA